MISQAEIDKKILQDIDLAIQEILKLYIKKSTPDAILLCGGYGRGEGAWYKDENGKLYSYNDYDFAIVGGSYIKREAVEELRVHLARLVGIRWIDIDFYSSNRLRHLRSTIKDYDFLYGSKIVWGNADILKGLKLDSCCIRKREIVVLYKTRIWTFLGSWIGDFHDLDIEEARFFKNQMAKAILSVCDMVLVSDGIYDSSYKKRIEIILERYKSHQRLCSLAVWALNEKMLPSSQAMKKEEMMELYWEAKDIFCTYTKSTMPGFWSALQNEFSIRQYEMLHSKWIIKCFFYYVFHHSRFPEKELDVFSAQNMVFLSNNHGIIDEEKLRRSAKLLEKWKYLKQSEENEENWVTMRETVAWARNNLI